LFADIQRDWMLQEYGRALARMEEHWRAAPQDPVRRLHYATILGHCSHFHAAWLQLDELVTAATPERRLWALGSACVACCDFQRFDWAAEYMRQAAAEAAPPPAVFHRWAEAPAMPRRHAFLVGCPRSGTTLLERMLGNHPQLASSSESAVWHSAVWMPLLRECTGPSGMRAVLAAYADQMDKTTVNKQGRQRNG
jgi:hypothetical protein